MPSNIRAKAKIVEKLDAIDSVREKLTGLKDINLKDEVLNHLPQFVACGAQSAGKSSVIRCISKIPLPEDTKCCTRIATIIQTRRGEESITVKLIGPEGREFESTAVRDLSEIRDIVSNYQSQVLGDNDFVHDYFVIIKYSAPQNFNFSMVDLPGFHNSNDVSSAIVNDIVHKYIKMEGTLCLHVCKGDQDYDSVLGNG